MNRLVLVVAILFEGAAHAQQPSVTEAVQRVRAIAAIDAGRVNDALDAFASRIIADDAKIADLTAQVASLTRERDALRGQVAGLVKRDDASGGVAGQ